jgi:hypothetical protein
LSGHETCTESTTDVPLTEPGTTVVAVVLPPFDTGLV